MLFKKSILTAIAAKRVTLAFRRWKKPGAKVGDVIATAVGDLTVEKVEKIAIARIAETDLKRAGYPSRHALQKELAKHPGADVYRVAFRLKAKDGAIAKANAKPIAPVDAAPTAAADRPLKTAPAARPIPPRNAATPKQSGPGTVSPRPLLPPELRPRGIMLNFRPRPEPPKPPPAPENVRITKAELKSAIAALRNLDQTSEHGAWTATTLRLIDKYPARRAPDLAAAQRRDPLAFTKDVLRLKQLGLTENLEIGYRLSARGRAILEALTESQT